MANRLFDTASGFVQSEVAIEHTITDFFKIRDFGFVRFVVTEQYEATWYPTPDVLVDAGWFDLDIHNANLGDFNGDSFQDVVISPVLFTHVVDHPQTILEPLMFMQDGAGSFIDPLEISQNSMFPNMHMPYRTDVGDFNGDGKDDFAVAASQLIIRVDDQQVITTSELPLVGLGGDDFSFETVQNFNGLDPNDYGYGHALAVGDFNGDGLDDFASNRTIFYSDSRNNFNTLQFSALTEKTPSNFILSMAAADVDNDGFDDLIFSPYHSDSASNNGGEIFLLFGSENGIHPDRSARIANENRYVDFDDNRQINFINTIDFNGDGVRDLVFVEHKGTKDNGDSTFYYTGGFVRLYEGMGDGVFVERTEIIRDPYFQTRHGEGNIHVLDANGDGWDDIILTSYQASGPSWGDNPIAGETTIFINSRNGFDIVSESVFAYLDSYQIQGFEDLKAWQTRVIPKMIPVDLRTDGIVDFIGFVDTPWLGSPQVEPVYTYAYISEGIRPLGRQYEDEQLLGTSNKDRIYGYAGDDILIGGSGDDYLVGGDGIDVAEFRGLRSEYEVMNGEVSDFASDRDGNNQIEGIERIKFSDLNIALDLDGSAGQTAKTLAAVIGEEGLSNKEYVGIGLQLFDSGQSLATVCELALTAVGATTNEDVVNLLYSNLYGESPSDDQLQEYVELLNQGVFTKGSLAAAAAELTDDLGVIDLVGLAETGIEYV